MDPVDAKTLQEVTDTLHHWCQLIDQKNFDQLGDIFVPTFTHEASYPDGTSNAIVGLAEFVRLLHSNVGAGSRCGPTQHNVLNVRVATEGPAVRSVANFYAVHLGLGPYHDQLYSMWGTYSDSWVKAEQGWRIRQRRYRVATTQGPREMLSPASD